MKSIHKFCYESVDLTLKVCVGLFIIEAIYAVSWAVVHIAIWSFT